MIFVEIKLPSGLFISYKAYNEEKPNNLLQFCVKIQILNHHLLFCILQTTFLSLTDRYAKNVPIATRGGLHSVVSHKSVFGNQEIRQLEL